MQGWHWPGNVRELLNRLKEAIVMCEKGPLTRSDLGLE
jgi:transcriptional regulator of acetoin/glycerol metabolism